MNPLLPAASVPTGSTLKSAASQTFRQFASMTASAMGSPWAFVLATLAIVIWACLGPHFRYSDTWQLVINTGTTIITFLMVFLIQNTQNRDARAIQLKLDELIRGTKGPRNQMIDIENCGEDELAKFEVEFKKHRERQTSQRSQSEKIQ